VTIERAHALLANVDDMTGHEIALATLLLDVEVQVSELRAITEKGPPDRQSVETAALKLRAALERLGENRTAEQEALLVCVGAYLLNMRGR